MKKFSLIILALVIVTLGLLWYVKREPKFSSVRTDSAVTSTVGEPSIPHVEVAFLDIGQGDATFITFPDGQQMLVDCAVDNIILEALGRVMKFYDRDIDYLLVTHPDSDHYGGCIEVLERYDVKQIVYNGLMKPNESFWRAFNDAVSKERGAGADYQIIDATSTLEIAGAKLTFLYPDHLIEHNQFVPGETRENDNNTSIIFKLSYGEEDVLMTGDMELELERYLTEQSAPELDVEVFKVGHHGSDTSSNKTFLEAVSPEYAVISSGRGNKYGHPSRRVLKRLERSGARILRTDTEGDIIMEIVNDKVMVKE